MCTFHVDDVTRRLAPINRPVPPVARRPPWSYAADMRSGFAVLIAACGLDDDT
jgi:hypothetical protein